jgi:hypothetical protein
VRDLHAMVRAGGLKQRVQTRAALKATLAAIAAGRSAEVAAATLADRLRIDYPGEDGDAAWAVAEALRSLDKAVAWEPAVEAADGNAERFRDAARLIASKALRAERRAPWSKALLQALEILADLDDFDSVRQTAAYLQRAPISAPVTNLLEARRPWKPATPASDQAPAPVVLLRFTLNDTPVSWPMALHTGRGYRLEASATADTWPAEADRLVIKLEGSVPASVLERQDITIRREDQTGQAYLTPRAEIGPNESIELTPTVSFIGADEIGIPAGVIGQRSLRVTTFDPATLGSGQPMVAQRIIELLGELNARVPSLPAQDRRNLIYLLDATARFAALANERKDLRGLDELGFQAKLKQAFLQYEFIGRRIQEAPKLGGGTTDLILERIVDELKISHDPIKIDDADKFVRQPTQYASAGDCPISMLTVLDDSPKSDPPGIQSNYMRWAYPRLHGLSKPSAPSMIAVVIIPVGFPVPSDWSDRAKGEVDHGG